MPAQKLFTKYSLWILLVSVWVGAYTVANDITASTDGYEFLTKEFTQLDVKLKVVYYDSIEELQLEAQIKEFTFWSEILAFSEVTDNYCEVHMVDPEVEYRPERLGHEITHCLHGNWHPRMDTMTISLPGEGMPVNED